MTKVGPPWSARAARFAIQRVPLRRVAHFRRVYQVGEVGERVEEKDIAKAVGTCGCYTTYNPDE
jgi:hypothetical protein